MKKTLISILVIILFVFLSYSLLQNNQSISLAIFPNIPSEIDGFSCFVFNSKEDMVEKKYLGVGDIGVQFFASVNGQLKEFSKKNDILTSGEYELNITQSKTPAENTGEYYEISGVITIKNTQNDKVIVKDFVGYCTW